MFVTKPLVEYMRAVPDPRCGRRPKHDHAEVLVCLVAGFLAGWLEHRSYAMAHKLGAAAGSATAFSDGLAAKDHVMALLNTF